MLVAGAGRVSREAKGVIVGGVGLGLGECLLTENIQKIAFMPPD